MNKLRGKIDNTEADPLNKKLLILRKRVLFGSVLIFVALCSELIETGDNTVLPMILVSFIMTFLISVFGYYLFKLIYYKKNRWYLQVFEWSFKWSMYLLKGERIAHGYSTTEIRLH